MLSTPSGYPCNHFNNPNTPPNDFVTSVFMAFFWSLICPCSPMPQPCCLHTFPHQSMFPRKAPSLLVINPHPQGLLSSLIFSLFLTSQPAFLPSTTNHPDSKSHIPTQISTFAPAQLVPSPLTTFLHLAQPPPQLPKLYPTHSPSAGPIPIPLRWSPTPIGNPGTLTPPGRTCQPQARPVHPPPPPQTFVLVDPVPLLPGKQIFPRITNHFPRPPAKKNAHTSHSFQSQSHHTSLCAQTQLQHQCGCPKRHFSRVCPPLQKKKTTHITPAPKYTTTRNLP